MPYMHHLIHETPYKLPYKHPLDRMATAKDISAYLEEPGSDQHINEKGFGALHATAENPENLLEKAELLLKAGVNPNLRHQFPPHKNTALHTLIVNEMSVISIGFIDLVKKIGKIPLDLSIKDGEDKTTLILAAKTRNTRVLLRLLEENPSLDVVNAQDFDGRTALHYAAMLGMKVAVEALIASGARQNIVDNNRLIPRDYLEAKDDVVRNTLASISIDPDRDVNATSNAFVDTNFQPLQSLQSGNTYEQLRSKKEAAPAILYLLDNLSLVDSKTFALSGEKHALDAESVTKLRLLAESFTGTSTLETIKTERGLIPKELLESASSIDASAKEARGSCVVL